MTKAKEFRARAREVLTGRYWRAFLAGLVASVLGGVSYGSSGGAASGSSAGASNTVVQGDAQIPPEMVAVIAVLMGILLIVVVALLIVGSAVELGYDTFNLRLYESSEKPSVGLLFSKFSIFGKALALRLLIFLKVLLWTLLFVVPGIIAMYRYYLAPYVLSEHPELTASEAIERSKALMAGNKWRLFCLQFSFIGWFLLSLLTCGIGLVFLTPYIKAAETAFYRELTGASAAPAQTAEPAQAEGMPAQV